MLYIIIIIIIISHEKRMYSDGISNFKMQGRNDTTIRTFDTFPTKVVVTWDDRMLDCDLYSVFLKNALQYNLKRK